MHARSASRACVWHAFCTCRARAATSRPWFCPPCRATPLTPLLHHHATTTTLAPYSTAVRALLAARWRPHCASATVGAARATPARHLPLGGAQAYPLARRLALVASTSPYHTEWRFAVVLIDGRLGTDLHSLFKEAPSVSEPSGRLTPSH